MREKTSRILPKNLQERGHVQSMQFTRNHCENAFALNLVGEGCQPTLLLLSTQEMIGGHWGTQRKKMPQSPSASSRILLKAIKCIVELLQNIQGCGYLHSSQSSISRKKNVKKERFSFSLFLLFFCLFHHIVLLSFSVLLDTVFFLELLSFLQYFPLLFILSCARPAFVFVSFFHSFFSLPFSSWISPSRLPSVEAAAVKLCQH